MKTKILIVIFAALLVSCDNWLDINTNPNTASDVEAKLLFNYATACWSGNRTGGDHYLPIVLAGQTISTGGDEGWGAFDVYDIDPYPLGNTWKAYYSTAGVNLKQAIKIAESADPVQNNAIVQCKILFAALMYECTTLYGDVPYSEAFKDDISYPKFDAQKDVLENLLNLLDEAIAQRNDQIQAPFTITDYDLYYKGDMDKWIRFANSLKLKICMLMVDKDPTKATQIGQLIQADNMVKSAGDNFLFPFSTVAGKQNPKYKILERYAGGTNIFFFANKHVTDFMNDRNDPRRSVYFDLAEDETDYIGLEQNEDAGDTNASTISMYLYRPDAPDVIYSYQEQLFFEAEIYTRGLGVTKDLAKAQERFEAAIRAAMTFYTVDAAAIDKYIAEEVPQLSQLADPRAEISMHQWVDLMDRACEAFTQWRRSGPEGSEVPKLTVPYMSQEGAGLFRRYIASPDEATANPNTPKDIYYYTKQWFDE